MPGTHLAADSERVEHVSVTGEVIEVVTRSELRRRRLRHRCTYIAVVTTDRRIVVHRRADWKDVFPGYWDLCFGGICGVGEPWLPAAQRELLEEVLHETISELRMEIADTDSHDYRLRLHQREDMLKQLLKRLNVEVEIENL